MPDAGAALHSKHKQKRESKKVRGGGCLKAADLLALPCQSGMPRQWTRARISSTGYPTKKLCDRGTIMEPWTLPQAAARPRVALRRWPLFEGRARIADRARQASAAGPVREEHLHTAWTHAAPCVRRQHPAPRASQGFWVLLCGAAGLAPRRARGAVLRLLRRGRWAPPLSFCWRFWPPAGSFPSARGCSWRSMSGGVTGRVTGGA